MIMNFGAQVTTAYRRDNPDLIGALVDNASVNVASQTDEILRVVLSEHLGEGFLLEDLEGRLCSVRYDGQPQEILTLDGRPIMELWPVEVTTVVHDNKWTLAASRKWRRL